MTSKGGPQFGGNIVNLAGGKLDNSIFLLLQWKSGYVSVCHLILAKMSKADATPFLNGAYHLVGAA